jgi:peptide/nickel transport system substrate-binding protein
MTLIAHRRLLATTTGLAAAALVLAGCSGDNGSSNGASTGGGGGSKTPLTIGTTDKITSIDPAGSYDNGSFAVMNQVYAFLLDTPYGSPDVQPELAESASFTSPTEYTVKLKPGLKFANGHDLTSSDVKFTFDRQVKINDPNGPASLLYNLDSVSAPDPTTVVFKLKAANDQIFPQVLSSPVGPIVDEEVFSPDKVTADDDIVKGDAFEGPYTITSYKVNELIAYKANPDYQGLLGAPKTANVNAKYYADASNLKLDVQQGNIDVAFHSLTATDIADLRTDKNVKVVEGPGGSIRYIVFNFNSMPYGAKTPEADPAKALAVRQAAADLIDRQAITDNVYHGTWKPLYSPIAAGLTGQEDVFKTLYGDGKGGPDAAKAKATLDAAGVPTPVKLSLQYNTDHYGPSGSDEYAQIKAQLEKDGIFQVSLASTEYTQYSKDRVKDVYPAYQLGWYPDYSDADNYLSPFFVKDNFLANHYDNKQVQDLISKEATTADPAARADVIKQIQELEAKDISTLPYMQGNEVAVTRANVSGADTTLDASFKFRYAPLKK